MRQIERTAYIWEKERLFSLELAESYMAGQQKRHTEQEIFASALSIHGRALTATETNYIDSWMKLGFGKEAAEIAYDKTVTATGKFDWKYANGIFQSWHNKGLHQAAEIAAGDTRQMSRQGEKTENGQTGQNATQEDMDRMKDLVDRLRRG